MNTKPIDGPEALREATPGGCTAFMGDRRCTAVATTEGLMGCVHEHVKPVAHCARHQDVARGGRMKCRQCRGAGVTVFAEVIYR